MGASVGNVQIPGGAFVDVLGDSNTDLTTAPVVVMRNLTGTPGTISVNELPCDRHPTTSTYRAFGLTLDINTTLANGSYRMFVSIPFDSNAISQFDLNEQWLRYYDGPPTNDYQRFYVGNSTPTVNSECRTQQPGGQTTNQLLVTCGLGASALLGDGGAYVDTTTGRGFVWGVVDHTTDFSAALPVCVCGGDLSGDGQRDGNDIQAFVACLMGIGPDCTCADLDDLVGLGLGDVTEFVNELLAGTACP